MSYLRIFFAFVFVYNLGFSWFLGLDVCVLQPEGRRRLFGLGVGFSFFLASAALATWAVNRVLLTWLGLEFLQTLVFVLIVVALLELTHILIRRFRPRFHDAISETLSGFAVNSAVLGITLIAVRSDYGALESIVAGFSAGIGLYLAAGLMALLRDQLALEWIPKPFRGLPIAFITAGLIAMAFMAFDRVLMVTLFG